MIEDQRMVFKMMGEVVDVGGVLCRRRGWGVEGKKEFMAGGGGAKKALIVHEFSTFYLAYQSGGD